MGLQKLKEGKIPGGYHGPRSAVRYKGLNLHSYYHRGTLEFRHHQGTVDPMDLFMWPLVCGWFVEIVSRASDREAARWRSLPEVFKPIPRLRKLVEWVEEKTSRYPPASVDSGLPVEPVQ